jgi:hypothetical protein
MRRRWQQAASGLAMISFVMIALLVLFDREMPGKLVAAEEPTPTPTPTGSGEFNQTEALAKLREQIKGHENDPAPTVFKNIQTPFIKSIPAGRLPAVMEIAYSRSLGVDCTHCHVPEKWESDEKPEKQIARDMAAMMAKINTDLLKVIKNLKSANPTINCTTCHRGQVKPALNLPQPAKS